MVKCSLYYILHVLSDSPKGGTLKSIKKLYDSISFYSVTRWFFINKAVLHNISAQNQHNCLASKIFKAVGKAPILLLTIWSPAGTETSTMYRINCFVLIYMYVAYKWALRLSCLNLFSMFFNCWQILQILPNSILTVEPLA